MGGQRGFRHGPPGGGSLAGPTDNKNRMAGAGSERSDAASPHGRSGSELPETGCGSVPIRGARARFHDRPGVDQSPRPRGQGDQPHLAPHPRWGRLYPRGEDAPGFPLDPARAPGTAGAQGLDLPAPGPPWAWSWAGTAAPGPGPSAQRSGAASRPAALPSPGSPRRATVGAVRPSTPFPRDKPGGHYPAGPTRRGRGARRRRGPQRRQPPRPCRLGASPARGPCAPSPGPTRTPPATRARPALLLNLLAASPHRPSPHAREAGAAPGPAGGRPPLLQPQAAARAPGEREAPPLPPARPPATRRGPGSARRPRRRSARRASQSFQRPVRPSPARPPAAAAAAAAPPLPPPLSSFPFSFASSGAELGKPAPAAGDHRELKQETPSPGENPGGVERGEGSCWNLSGSTGPLRPPEVPAPPRLAPSPGVPTSQSRSPLPGPGRRPSARLRLLHPAIARIIPWAAKGIAVFLFPCLFAYYQYSVMRGKRTHTRH